MNRELLLKVKAVILEEPSRLDMYRWLEHHPPGRKLWDTAYSGTVDAQLTVPSCGTVGCIAGWVIVLAGKENESLGVSLSGVAAEALGLSQLQADSLFYHNAWSVWSHDHSNRLKDLYDNSPPGSVLRAQIVAEVIDLFLEMHS